jgi:hypothetical protein
MLLYPRPVRQIKPGMTVHQVVCAFRPGAFSFQTVLG